MIQDISGLLKKKRYWAKHCLCISLCACFFSGSSIVNAENKKFYDDRKRGYYWYEKQPEPPAEKEIEKKEESGTSTRNVPETKSFEELWNMHPEDFQKYVTEVQNYAIQYPTVANVERYYYVNAVSTKKATAFAAVAEYVGYVNPGLSNDATYPVTTPGQQAVSEARIKEKDEAIYNARDHFALIVFTQKNCGFCETQNKILRFFKNKYGWPIKEIDIAEKPGISAYFAIETTPTIILIKKEDNENYLNISTGVAASEVLAERVSQAIKVMNGTARPEQLNMWEYERNTNSDPLAPVKTKMTDPDIKKK